jgi:multiple sugar transport system ATP-binding protein
MAGEEGHIVARLDPQSDVRVGRDSELWVDASRIHLFDPEDGRNLTTDARGPAATDGGQGAGGRDPEVSPAADERPAEGAEQGGEPPPAQPR